MLREVTYKSWDEFLRNTTLLGSTVYGFAVITLFFVVVLLAIVIYREKIIESPIMDTVIRELNKPEKDEKKSKE